MCCTITPEHPFYGSVLEYGITKSVTLEAVRDLGKGQKVDVIIQKNYRIDGLPGTITISDEDVIAAAAPYPATVSFDEQTAFLHFESPLAAADFVNSLQGQVPYKVEGMTEVDKYVFNDPMIRREAREKQGPNINMIDKGARHWGIAAFSVACSATGIAIAALVLAIIGLVS